MCVYDTSCIQNLLLCFMERLALIDYDIINIQPLRVLPSHTTLHTPFTQMFRELLLMKHGVPSVTVSSIFSEKYSFTGRQCSSHGPTARDVEACGWVFPLAPSSGWCCGYSCSNIIFSFSCKRCETFPRWVGGESGPE